jgi:hypothetical protein
MVKIDIRAAASVKQQLLCAFIHCPQRWTHDPAPA